MTKMNKYISSYLNEVAVTDPPDHGIVVISFAWWYLSVRIHTQKQTNQWQLMTGLCQRALWVSLSSLASLLKFILCTWTSRWYKQDWQTKVSCCLLYNVEPFYKYWMKLLIMASHPGPGREKSRNSVINKILDLKMSLEGLKPSFIG